MPLPRSKFTGALPNLGVWAACLAVLFGQSKALTSNAGLSTPVPPKLGLPVRSGRHLLKNDELQLAAAIFIKIGKPVLAVVIPDTRQPSKSLPANPGVPKGSGEWDVVEIVDAQYMSNMVRKRGRPR